MTGPRLNPRKLLLSKWTATAPSDREKHFLVSRLILDEAGALRAVELEAVYSHRCQRLDWHTLSDTRHWRIGWH